MRKVFVFLQCACGWPYVLMIWEIRYRYEINSFDTLICTVHTGPDYEVY